MSAYEIPPELRSWVEATAPTLTADGNGWAYVAWVHATQPGTHHQTPQIGPLSSGITPEQARALLAYRDGQQ